MSPPSSSTATTTTRCRTCSGSGSGSGNINSVVIWLVVSLAVSFTAMISLGNSTNNSNPFLHLLWKRGGENNDRNSSSNCDAAAHNSNFTVAAVSARPLFCSGATTTTTNDTDYRLLPIDGPTLMIIGAMKSGTTALSKILQRVYEPQVVRSIRPEAHYFDKIRMQQINRRGKGGVTVDSQRKELLALLKNDSEMCGIRHDYVSSCYSLKKLSEAVDRSNRNKLPILVYEKSPDYLRIPGISAIVHRLFAANDNSGDATVAAAAAATRNASDHAPTAAGEATATAGIDGGGSSSSVLSSMKVIALLRDPVDRLNSEFRMLLHTQLENQLSPSSPYRASSSVLTFDDFANVGIRAVREANLTRAPSLEEYRGRVLTKNETVSDEEFALWDDVSPEEWADRVVRLYQLHQNYPGGHAKVAVFTGMYALQLPEWLGLFDNDMLVLHFERLQSDRSKGFRDILKHAGVPHDVVAGLDDAVFEENYYPSRAAPEPEQLMTDVTGQYLRQLYKPFNRQLATVLGDDSWRNAWGY